MSTATEAKTVNAQVVTVVNVNPKHPLRITMLGSQPLANGAKFRVSTDLAQQLVRQYGKFLEVSPTVQPGVKLLNGTWEPVSGAANAGAGKGEKADPGDKLGEADTPAKTEETVSKPANKDLAGKAAPASKK